MFFDNLIVEFSRKTNWPKAPKQSLYDEDKEEYEEETVNEDTVDEEADEDEK